VATTDYGTVPLGDPTDLRNMREDRSAFEAFTVYFDFDRSTVKASEQAKVEEVSKYLMTNPTHAVRIEGHCDERGTEGYNLSLGDRRALAVREYLVNLGVPDSRIDTISYGESRPAVIGTTDAAYAKNRRGEFILLLP
jgi:peptidoglycan-associated lipoprotein